MKAFILKTNTKLLETYPNIWNTRLLWMCLISLGVHILFFLFGFVSLIDPTTLQERDVDSLFFRNGGMLLSIVISLIILVIWLLQLFKNNAFKAFYPIKNSDLFSQFACYFIIIFISTTYFYSFSFGLKSYVSITHKDQTVSKHIGLANNTAMFFSQNVEDYLIDKARYPDFFYTHFCESNYGLIDRTKPYYEIFERQFQFYSLKTIDVSNLQKTKNYKNYRNFEGYIHQEKIGEDTTRYYYKDSVLDASTHIKTLQPSYLNYSKTFYKDHQNKTFNSYSTYNDYNYNSYNNYTPLAKEQNKKNVTFLNTVSKAELTKQLNSFIEMVNAYKIPHNLSAEKWATLIYKPSNFEVTAFIRNNPPPLYNDDYINEELQASEIYYKERLTNFYIESDKLHNTFENINAVKNNNPLDDSVHVFLWIAFSLATLIFIFRITGLKLLLLSAVSVGVISIFVALIIVVVNYGLVFDNTFFEYFSVYTILFVATFILAVPLFFYKKFKKSIVGIAINISISGFVLYVFLILGIISLHQRYYCDNYLYKIEENCYNYTILDQLGFAWSYVFLILGFVFIYFYSSIIKRWKALPEA